MTNIEFRLAIAAMAPGDSEFGCCRFCHACIEAKEPHYDSCLWVEANHPQEVSERH